MIVLYSDGGYRMNRGVGAWSWIMTRENKKVRSDAHMVMDSTSNRCEYLGMINGIIACVGLDEPILCVSDSQLMIQQLGGAYKVNDPTLWQLWNIIVGLTQCFDNIKFGWRSRETQWLTECDKLCDGVIDNNL